MNTDALVEAHLMATFESTYKTGATSKREALRLAAQTGAQIIAKFKIVRRGLGASRDQDAQRKVLALSTLQEMLANAASVSPSASASSSGLLTTGMTKRSSPQSFSLCQVNSRPRSH